MIEPLRRMPEVEVRTHRPSQLERLRALSRLLDSAIAIPGTRFRFGLDAVIGLVPGIGDVIGALFSSYIIYHAARMGTPRSTLARMIANVGVDTLVGEIPLLGDLFDFGFKSNLRNLALLEEHLHRPTAAKAQSRRVLLLLSLGVVLLFVAVIGLGVAMAQLVLNSVR